VTTSKLQSGDELARSVRWRDGWLEVIDQTLLPQRLQIRRLSTVADVIDAIRRLVVRGAPAIGVCGAFGMVLGLDEGELADAEVAHRELDRLADVLSAARPTAVNLSWAVNRVRDEARRGQSPEEIRHLALAEAQRIQREDEESCRRIGQFGREALASARRILTHCNTGRLATTGLGTALGVVYAKAAAGEVVEVLASETRPLLQGARLTAWELHDAGIPVTVLPDSAAGSAMARGLVDVVIVGCDRVARNGDTANKIGTYTHAVVARQHGIPFFVAGPMSSFDPAVATGTEIIIEERGAEEVLPSGGEALSSGVHVLNPAFDVTPAKLITAFITEVGVLRPPFEESIGWALDTAAREGLR
jgi:methylthioribose-1-phosphate isomerase